MLPTPLDVATDLVTNPGAYAGDTARTFGLALFGVVVGMALGFAVSVATWASSLIAGAVSPLVLMLRSIPIVAVIPVVARLVGYGNKIVPIVTIMLAFFPAYVMTSSGLRSASPTSLDLMTSLGASRWTALRRLLVPTAVPSVLVALRLCASSAVLAAMVAEFLAGTNGLGRLFSTHARPLRDRTGVGCGADRHRPVGAALPGRPAHRALGPPPVPLTPPSTPPTRPPPPEATTHVRPDDRRPHLEPPTTPDHRRDRARRPRRRPPAGGVRG